MEAAILASAVKDREAFDELLIASIDNDLTDLGKIVWKEIKEYYGADPKATCVTDDVLYSALGRKYEKHVEKIKDFLSSAPAVSPANVVKEVFELKLEATRHKMSQALVAGKDDDYLKLREDYDRLKRGEMEVEGTASEVVVSKSLDSILATHSTANKIKLLPKALNVATDGGAIKGNHIVVFAPTEMGKSLFCLNMAYGFLKQGLRVMYGCNEDPQDTMLLRLFYRLAGMTKAEIELNPAQAEKNAIASGYNNLIYVDLQPGTELEIRDLVEEYQPDVLMVDQIRNLDMKESNKVISLEKAAVMMRNIGKSTPLLAVSITQAADSATGKVMLDRGDIDFSNIGIPGTADLMIGIGADGDMEMRGQRCINLPKNKLSGEHQPMRVLFDNKLTKVS